MNIIKALVLVFVVSSSSTYANCVGHKTFVHSIKQQVDNIFTKGDKRNQQYVYKKHQEIIQNNVDLKEISRFVIGKHWTLVTQKEREDFLKEYKTYFINLCAKILYKYTSDSEMLITSSRVINNAACLISTRFSYGNEEFINIDFKITKNDSSFLISDIAISGISISINQRSQFSEKIDTYGIMNVISELKCNNSL